MPAASSSKRVKNTRISRPFIIGSEAWNLTPQNHPDPIPEGHTKGWRVYVKGLEGGPKVSSWLKKVQFKLHHTYANASRTIEEEPFQVQETGYGEFEVELRLYFDSASGEKAQYRIHRLRLEPYGTEAEQAAQRAANSVVAETLEIVEFNEPSQEFFAKMTSEEQFEHLRKKSGGKGRGKGRGGKGEKEKIEYEGDREPSANLPERASENPNWNRQREKQLLDMLANAQRELNNSIEQERKKAEERQRRLAALA